MHSYELALALGAIAVASSSASAAETKSVKVENGTLTIDGKPFFFVGVDGVPGSVAEMMRHHLNTIFTWRGTEGLLEVADDARKHGIWLMGAFQAPGADLEAVARDVEQLRKLPNILAWNIGDDLHGAHYAPAKAIVDLIRRLDETGRPIAADAIIDEARIMPLIDLFCLYTYPLQQHPLSWYRRFLEERRGITLRDDQILWTWPQVHTGFWYLQWVHERRGRQFYEGPRSFPNAEHVRLITYEALSAGCKGLLFFHWRFLTGDEGIDRYAEIGRLGCELEVLGAPLAAAKPEAGAVTNRPDVHAQAFSYPEGKLFLLVVEREEDHFQVDEGVMRDVELRAPSLPGDGAAIWLSPSGPQELPVTGGALVVPEVDLTAALIVAASTAERDRIRDEWQRLLPEYAAFTVEAAEGLQGKTRGVREELALLGRTAEGADAHWQRAGAHIDAGRAALEAGDDARAAGEGQAALAALRSLQHQAWKQAQEGRLPRHRDWNDLHRLCFYDLPTHWRRRDRAAAARPSADMLRHGALEQWQDGAPVGWEVHPFAGEGAKIEADPGGSGVRLSSTQPMPTTAWWYDHLSIAIDSEPIPVKAGALYEVSALAHVPSTITGTHRGATVTVLAQDGDGKTVWGADERETGRTDRTEAPVRIRFVVETTKEVAVLQVRLGLAGAGSADFSEVTLRALTE